MSLLFAKAFGMLVYFDFPLVRRDFRTLYETVRDYPVHPKRSHPDVIESICSSIDMASIWYWKQVLCLQRSAAATCLLRRHGFAAFMVIGAQHLPFRAHAWVEVGGRVVNDKPSTPEMYAVLDRC